MLGDITKNSELITFLECNSLKSFRYIVHLFLLITIKSYIELWGDLVMSLFWGKYHFIYF